ncbi:MBL fold metallo-hydrolase [Candidatus Bathyarchaeota archaeon]|nr:MBL fold metallo-hydrolase [Candidatus Bathyarchaeota archaeon]
MSKVGSLKITTLADNIVQKSGFHGQWGLSFLLELEDAKGVERRIVFDTGNDRVPLLHNIRVLKVRLRDVDCVVLSHGHGDHTAATVEIVRQTGGVKVYAHPYVFQPRFTVDKQGRRRRGGVPPGERISDIKEAGGEVVLTPEPVEIVPGVWTTGEIPRRTLFEKVSPPFQGGRRLIRVDGADVEDLILDDQAVFMDVDGVGPLVVTGCAHAGVINTILRVRELGGFGEVYGLVGGTHLAQRSDEYVDNTIEALGKFDLKLVSPCHCTGFKATARLMQSFPEEFVLNFCGRVIEAGETPDPVVV